MPHQEKVNARAAKEGKWSTRFIFFARMALKVMEKAAGNSIKFECQTRETSDGQTLTQAFTLSSSQQIELQRLRLEPQLSRLLQAKHQANSTRNRSRQGLDIKDSVFTERIITRRSFGKRFYPLYHPD